MNILMENMGAVKTVKKGGMAMPRGRSWYGPGFWKDAMWHPGAGGFRGGYAPGWGCRWFHGSPGPYYIPGWDGAYPSGPAEERAFLQDQREELKAHLSDLERRLAELDDAKEES